MSTDPAKTTAVDDARVMRIWRECGLPEYFLGNGGTNDKLVRFADAIDEDDNTNVRQVAREIRLQDEARVAELGAQLRQEREARESHECGDTCDALQAQVAQLKATVGQLRESVTAYRAAHPGCGRSGYDKCDYCDMADAALATCPAPEEQP